MNAVRQPGTLPHTVLEPHHQLHHGHALPPRATRILAPGDLPGLASAIWMGGAHSLIGDPIHPELLTTSWLVDAAGDLPPSVRAAAAAHIPCVFSDLEVPALPSRHILPLVDRIAGAVTVGEGPAAVYFMCTHGMNRSGLLTGLLLRRLGLPAAEAIDRIRAARPGALGNASFVRLIHQA